MPAKEKDFVSVRYSDSLSENYKRILKDTLDITQVNYHKRYVSWGLQSIDDLKEFIENIDRKWQNGDYRYATVRQYKAVINYALSSAHQFKKNPKELNHKFKEYYLLSQEASQEELETLYHRNMLIGKKGDIPTLDKNALSHERTSTTKDKRFPQPLVDRILEFTDDRYSLLQSFIVINTKIGLRPIEYQYATLLRHDIAHNPKLLGLLGFTDLSSENALGLVGGSNDTHKPLLLVRNAKNSHARACGDYRLLYLDVLSNKEIKQLQLMMQKMRDINEGSKKGFSKAVISPLSSLLYRTITTDNKSKFITKRLHDEKMRSYRKQSKKGFRNKPVFKRPTLYSTRHQAVANAKSANLHPILIAACFGHSSVFTAESHYGKAVFGTGGLSVKPTQVSINEVISRLTEAGLTQREPADFDYSKQKEINENTPPTQTYTPRI